MGIIEKEKNFRAILAASIILIGKRLSRSELSSLVENHLLTCAIRFCFFVFSNFFVNMLFFTKFCWNFDKYSLWHAFCSFFCFLVFNFCSLLFIDFAFFLSLRDSWITVINIKNVALHSVVLNLVQRHSQFEAKIRMQILGKSQQRAIYLLLYIHIYFYFFWLGLSNPICYFVVKFCIFLEFSNIKRREFFARYTS